MAWAQALAWMPITIFWVREVSNLIMVAALGALGAVPVWLTVTGRGSAGLVATLLIVYIATAYLVAWAAVASDRRGQAWRFWPAQSTLSGYRSHPELMLAVRRPFRSPFAAQVWYEWRCHGLMLNGFVGVHACSAIWGVLLLRHGHGNPQWFAHDHRASSDRRRGALSPRPEPASAGLDHSGAILQARLRLTRSSPRRPMTTGRLVAAKFRMSAASVILTWALAVAGTTFWIVVSDNLDDAAIVARDSLSRYPGGRGFAIIALACILLPALSWRLLTGSLVPVFTGRRWVADGAAWLFLAFLAGLGGCGFWLTKSSRSSRSVLLRASLARRGGRRSRRGLPPSRHFARFCSGG